MKTRQRLREERRRKRARLYRLAQKAGSPEMLEHALIHLPPGQREAILAESAQYFEPGAFSWWRRIARKVRWCWRPIIRWLNTADA